MSLLRACVQTRDDKAEEVQKWYLICGMILLNCLVNEFSFVFVRGKYSHDII